MTTGTAFSGEPTPAEPRFLSGKRAMALCAALAFATYLNTLWFGFAYDDDLWIVHNGLVRSLRNIPHFFATGQLDNRTYRPLAETWFALDWAAAGQHAWFYHLENVLLHAGVVLLLYRLFRRVAPHAAPLAAALFGVVAIHSEAVANITGRTELLACFLGLLALSYIERPAIAAALLFLGLFAKETPVVIPGIAFVMWWKPGRAGSPAAPDGASAGRRPTRRVLLSLAALAVAIGAFAAWRRLGAHCCDLFPPDYVNAALDNVLYLVGWAARLRTGLMLLSQDLVLCLVPYHLSADYSLAQIVPVARWLEAEWLIWTALLAVILAAGFLGRRRFPNVARGLAWFLAAALPVSNVLVPIGTIRGERLLYLASAGVCLAAAELLMAATAAHRRLVPVLIALLVLTEGAVAAHRNLVWRDQGTLMRSLVADAPRSARAHFNLATLNAREGHCERALPEFQRAIRLYPPFFRAWQKQAECYRDLNDLAAAETSLHVALSIAPREIEATQILADVCGREGNWECVASAMERLLRISPEAARDPGAWVVLGTAEARSDNLEAAEAAFRHAIAAGRAPLAHFNLAGILLREGRTTEALEQYRTAESLGMQTAALYEDWATAEQQAGHANQAQAVARRGLRKYPRSEPLRRVAR